MSRRTATARCVVSLATGDGLFPQQLHRLQDSVERSRFRGEFLAWPPDRFPVGCPPHRQVPFAFKPFCLMDARDRGFDSLLWLDSSCVVVRSLERLFRLIEEQGYLLFRNGEFRVGEWASDGALARLGLSRAEAMLLPEVNGAAIGLSTRAPVAMEFLECWSEESIDGVAFRGVPGGALSDEEYDDIKSNRSGRISSDPRVRGHRHDQTVAGILAHRLGMKLSGVGFHSYSGKSNPSSTVVVNDRAMRWRDGPFQVLRRLRAGRR